MDIYRRLLLSLLLYYEKIVCFLLCLLRLQAVDIGGSMFVHVFGAYFGLAASRVLFKPGFRTSQKEGSVYHSDVFAMIGQ